MKKGWKIFWITCAIAGGLGIFCLAIAIGMGVTLEIIQNRFPNGIRIGKFETVEDDEDDTASYEGISKLDIELSENTNAIGSIIKRMHHINCTKL